MFLGSSQCAATLRVMFPSLMSMVTPSISLPSMTPWPASGRGCARVAGSISPRSTSTIWSSCARNSAFRAAYARMNFVSADGAPVAALARQEAPMVQRATGADLLVPLCRMAARDKIPVALFGSTRESLDAAARRLRALAPGLDVAFVASPAFGFDPFSSDAGFLRRGDRGKRRAPVLGLPRRAQAGDLRRSHGAELIARSASSASGRRSISSPARSSGRRRYRPAAGMMGITHSRANRAAWPGAISNARPLAGPWRQAGPWLVTVIAQQALAALRRNRLLWFRQQRLPRPIASAGPRNDGCWEKRLDAPTGSLRIVGAFAAGGIPCSLRVAPLWPRLSFRFSLWPVALTPARRRASARARGRIFHASL